MFSSKSFTVSGLTFRSLTHFEFIFVYGVGKCSNFILLHEAVQFSQHHLLKRLSLPHCIFLPLLSKTRHPQVHGFFLGFLSCSVGLYFCFCASSILSWWLQLCSIVWSQEGWSLWLHSSFSRLLWLFGVFCVSTWIVKFSFLVLWKILGIKSPFDPAIPLLGIHPEETRIEKDTCIPLFIAALFTIAKRWKQLRCPSTDEWIAKLQYIYTMEYYSVVKRNTFESVLMRCMNLELYYTEWSESERER